MKLAFALAVAMLSGSIPLAGQQGSSGVAGQATNGSSLVLVRPGSFAAPETLYWFPPLSNCPAMFRAQHLADGSMIRTGIRTGRTHPKGTGQWLHITLNTRQGAIATLAVHGFTDKGRITQAVGGSAPDAVRTVTVYLAAAQNGQVAGDIWAPELTAVTSIDLISLAYDDGGSWNAAAGKTCRVTPDPLMLVSGR